MDQIILEVPLNKFDVINREAFEPHFYPIPPQGYKYRKFVGVRRLQGYYPQISINGRPNKKLGYQFTLKIQVSVPKLLYGNNLQDVFPSDEEMFYSKIKEICKLLGVILKGNLFEYKVIGFDPAINIYLSHGATSEQAIRYLYRSYTTKLTSFDKRDFRDKGHAIYLHRGKWNLVIYDKREDLIKPKYKRMDKIQKAREVDIHKSLGNQEVLRIELHGRNQSKLRKFYKRFFPDIEYVHCGLLFKTKYWKVMLREFVYEEILRLNRFALTFDDTPMSWYRRVRYRYPNLTEKKIRDKLGLIWLAKDEEGLKVYRRSFEKRHSQRQWYELVKEIKELQGLVLPNDYFSFIHDINKALWYADCPAIV